MEKKVIVKYYFLQSILGKGISGRADTVTIIENNLNYRTVC